MLDIRKCKPVRPESRSQNDHTHRDWSRNNEKPNRPATALFQIPVLRE